MDLTVQLFLVIGGLLIAGLIVDTYGRNRFIPRVTLLMGLGILVSPSGFDLLPANARQWFDPIASIALVMVGFLLGEKFTVKRLREHGKQVVWISVGASLATSVVVGLGLACIGTPFTLTVLLAGIAAATDPAATVDVVNELKSKNEFSDRLAGIVALDDAWGLILFSLCASLALLANGDGAPTDVLLDAGKEIGGAILLGILLGLPAAHLTGRIDPGQPTLIEAIGVVFICGGLALWLDVSFLIASMTLGAVVANFARHHERPFHEVEGIEGPFLVLFFILAGASLEFSSLGGIGVLFGAYIGLRLIGKAIGGWIGGRLGKADATTNRWIGLALTPQAGVAIGMALIAINRFPDYRDTLLPTVIGSTIVFELIGPILTRVAIRKAESALPR